MRTLTLPSKVTVTSDLMNAELARLGPGVIQVPRYRYEDDLASGRLVEVLPDSPPTMTPVSLLYPEGQQLAARTRVFIDWAVDQFAQRLSAIG